jgi:hypothetical protein
MTGEVARSDWRVGREPLLVQVRLVRVTEK